MTVGGRIDAETSSATTTAGYRPSDNCGYTVVVGLLITVCEKGVKH
jgi:hypothetical protein